MLGSDRSHYKILLVDDEPDILEFVSYNLQREGYQIAQARNGFDALNLATEIAPHLILLDIMMPEMDGVTTCHRIRQETACQDTVIAFLTARHEEYCEIAGFDAGADDYIRKPISPSILKHRVGALLSSHNQLGVNMAGQRKHMDLTLDQEKFEASIGSTILELSKKEFEVLWLLIGKPGKVYSREEIYRHIWGSDVILANRTIDVHVSKLCQKLGPHFIKIVKGIGYKLEDSV